MAQLLLVDDDPDQLEIRQLIMEQAGHTVEVAPTASKALATYDRTSPDVVVMDLRLPRAEDGIHLIRQLRERSETVRILVLSGWPEDLARQPEAKMVNGYLRKPVKSAHLVRLISQTG